MRFTRFPIVAAAPPLLALLALVSCNSDGRTLRPALASQNATIYSSSTTTSPVETTSAFDNGFTSTFPTVTTIPPTTLPFVLELPFQDGGAIDPKFTCTGVDVHPQVGWLGAPAGAFFAPSTDTRQSEQQ